jgi:NAD(P)-dependent dehydrogenase (short-subunit alcohol dehydrogenase family)
MSQELGVQFPRNGIRVNARSQGPVHNPLLRGLSSSDPERAGRRLVHLQMRQFAGPDEPAANGAPI